MRRVCCRNVIDSAGVPGVAPRDPPRSQPQPADDSVCLDGRDRIRTTARIEPTALAEERADQAAIRNYRDDDHPGRDAGTPRDGRTDRAARVDVCGLHCASAPSPTASGRSRQRRRPASRSPANCADDDPAAAGRTRTTRRAPAGSWGSRAATRCRSWRRIRLRTTAPPTARLTTKPARAPAAGDVASAAGTDGRSRWTTSRGRPARRPRRTAAVKSGRCRSRDAAGSISDRRIVATSGRQALTALPATRGKNGATGTSAHAQAEAVGLRAAAIVRLERALAHSGAPERNRYGRSTGRKRLTWWENAAQHDVEERSVIGRVPHNSSQAHVVQQVTRTSYGTGRSSARSNRSGQCCGLGSCLWRTP
jgi:hypothetical protein